MTNPKIEKLSRGGFRVRYYKDSKRITKQFKTLMQAKIFSNSVMEESSVPTNYSLNDEERLEYAVFRKKCAKLGITVSEAFNLLESTLKPKANNICNFSTLLESYKQYQLSANFREATITNNMYHISRFAKHMGEVLDIDSISKEQICRYVNSVKTKEHTIKSIKAFFAYLYNSKQIKHNPAYEIKLDKIKADETLPTILSVEDTKILFKVTSGQVKLYFALLAFAGIRPEELKSKSLNKQVLEWKHINLNERIITVPGEASKTRTTRHISNISANLLDLLKSVPASERIGKIITISGSTIKRAKANLPIELTKDVLRHSFGSYGYYRFGSEAVLDYMGHVGSKVFKRHYKGFSSVESATEYFSIELVSTKRK